MRESEFLALALAAAAEFLSPILLRSIPFLSIQSCVKIFLPSPENYPQNVPLPTPNMQYGAIFRPAIPKTGQEYFYTTL